MREEGIPPNLAESPITPLRQAQQAAGWASGAGLVETFQSVCETSMLGWASGASERAAWLWRRCWLSGARAALASQLACT